MLATESPNGATGRGAVGRPSRFDVAPAGLDGVRSHPVGSRPRLHAFAPRRGYSCLRGMFDPVQWAQHQRLYPAAPTGASLIGSPGILRRSSGILRQSGIGAPRRVASWRGLRS